MPINIDHSNNLIVTDDGLLNLQLDLGIKQASPQATLHMTEGSYTPSWSYFSSMQLISERVGDNSWVLATSDGSLGTIYFSDASDLDIGAIQYDHSTNTLIFRANNNSEMVWNGLSLNINSPVGTSTGVIRTQGGMYDYASSGNGGYGAFTTSLSTGGAAFRGYSGTNATDTFVDFDAPDITTADVTARFFRNTNTSGSPSYRIFQGDGTSTTQYQFNRDIAYLGMQGGKVGIGSTSAPAVSLDIDATDAIQLTVGTTAQRPTAAAGMLRYNSTLGTFEGYTTTWTDLAAAGGGGAVGGGSDKIFWENDQNVTTDYTITNLQNAMSAGPITINTGITVTVGATENWTIV